MNEAVAGKRWPAIALVVIASFIGFFAVFAIWVKRQVLETDTWTETSSKLLENEDIRNAVSDYLVAQLYANVDVEARLSKALPPRLKPLAGPASGAIRQGATSVAQRALLQPRVQTIWEDANRATHRQFLRVVEGGNGTVSTQGGDVTLDLATLVSNIGRQVGVGGGNLGAKLPPNAAELVILRSDELQAAQDGVNLLRILAWALAALTLVLYAIAIYISGPRRRETLRAVGLAFIAIGVVVLFARGLAGDAVVGALTSTAAAEPAANATWSIATSLLKEEGQAMILYGLAIFLAAWLAGPTSIAVGFRRATAPYLRQARIAYSALAILVVLLLWWAPTEATRRFVPAVLLIAFLALGVEMLRRRVATEFPDRVTALSPSGLAQQMAGQMRDARARRAGGGSAKAGVTPADARLEALERLGRLRESGVLSDEEFEREKRRLMEDA